MISERNRLHLFFITPIVVVALVFGLVSCDRSGFPVLVCSLQNRTVFIDGREGSLEWIGVDSVQVAVTGGMNLTDGETVVTVKAQRQGRVVSFLFKWKDDTRSYNRFLEKGGGGWLIMESEDAHIEGENFYWEDQLAISMHREAFNCSGNCHVTSDRAKDTIDVAADIWLAIGQRESRVPG